MIFLSQDDATIWLVEDLEAVRGQVATSIINLEHLKQLYIEIKIAQPFIFKIIILSQLF